MKQIYLKPKRFYVDPTGVFKHEDEYLVGDVFDSLNISEVRIRKTQFARILLARFCDEVSSTKPQGRSISILLDHLLDECYEELKRCIKPYKCRYRRLRSDQITIDFLRFVLGAELIEEYNRISNIINESAIEDVVEHLPEGIGYDEWLVHKVQYPDESVEEWKKREEENSKTFGNSQPWYNTHRDELAD